MSLFIWCLLIFLVQCNYFRATLIEKGDVLQELTDLKTKISQNVIIENENPIIENNITKKPIDIKLELKPEKIITNLKNDTHIILEIKETTNNIKSEIKEIPTKKITEIPTKKVTETQETKDHKNVPNVQNTKSKNNKQITHPQSYAWVSMASANIASILGARVLAQSLSKYSSTIEKILICIPGIEDKYLSMLRLFGWKTMQLNVNHWEHILSYPLNIQYELIKILAFNFTKYDVIGFLSSESMITSNIEHLFECGKQSIFCSSQSDKHHKIYSENQPQRLHLLEMNERSVFDMDIFVIKPDHDLYVDIEHFLTGNHANVKKEILTDKIYNSSFISEYFYYYCKGWGYPINIQTGIYDPPTIEFKCLNDKPCEMLSFQFYSLSNFYVLEF